MIFHIDLDAFFASVEERDNPSLRGKPIIVGGPGGVSDRGVVSTANYEARKYGVHSGMALYQARALCPHGVFLAGNFDTYNEASRKFYTLLKNVTPYVEDISIDEAYCSLYGCEMYYDDLVSLGYEIKNKIQKEIGITATIGIAPTKPLAKMATNSAKPNGLYQIKPGEELSFLTPRLVSEIPGCGPQTVKKLAECNIKTIGELRKLPYATLHTFFGKHGDYLWDIAHGGGSKTVTVDWKQKSVGRETTFPQNTTDSQVVKTTLLYLCHKVAQDIREKKYRGRCITLKIKSASFIVNARQHTIQTPTSTAAIIYETGLMLLDALWQRESLRLIGISISHFDENSHQLSLFQKEQHKDIQIEQSMDTIRSKYGFLSIYPASMHALSDVYTKRASDFTLTTPSLSR